MWGVWGVERLHQYSAVASYEECVGGEKEGGRVLVVEMGGAAHLQSRTVQWAGTMQLDRGLLDWPSPARAPGPAKTQGTAPVQTRELAALFVCLRAIGPRPERHVIPTKFPIGREKATKTSLALLYQNSALRCVWFLSENMCLWKLSPPCCVSDDTQPV